VGDSNVGSQMMPVAYADCCACRDDLDYPRDFEPNDQLDYMGPGGL
jgi:hypothetical protein